MLITACSVMIYASPVASGLHFGESLHGPLDAQQPTVAILYPYEQEIFVGETTVFFRWVEEEVFPGPAPADHLVSVTIDGEVYETVTYTPDPDFNEWGWIVPDTTSGDGQFHVQARDQFGNLTLRSSPRFTILPALAGVEPDPPATPGHLALAHPQPNPFNPSTCIAFDLPVAGHVSLAVHDLQGRRLCELARGPRPAGRHTVFWSGRNAAGRRVAGGIYLVQLVFESSDREAGDGSKRVLTRKVVLLP